MDITVIGLILIGVFGIFYAVLTWGNNKKTGGNSNNNNTNKQNNNNVNIDKKKVVTEVRRKDMFNFIEFNKIVDDMIIQEKESKYTMVIQCKGINYDLMSEIEQLAVEEGFITFLNTLKSPIQLYVQARAINLKTSLDIYKSRVDDINLKYNESTDRLKKLSNDINTTEVAMRQATVEREKFANISEYAQDITKYIEKLSLNKHMLQRKFYVVISYYKSEVNTTAEFSKRELHDICYRELYTRAQSLISGLQSCSVSSRVLTSNELAELLYISYNRDDEKLLDIKTALDSGFYRMYSTTKDIQEKKKDAMEKQIQEEAMNRVEQAIKTAIASGIIKSEDEMIEEFENTADIEAIKIIEDTNISDEEKKKIQQVIVDQHNKGIDDRKEERERVQKAKNAIKNINEAAKKEIVQEETNIEENKEITLEKNSEELIISKPKVILQGEKVENKTSNVNSSEDSII
ncbi:MAG: hypothetical protein PHD15_01210 [Clostridia bacterium]|nr:hypothetical protein [Clostridia bacterium]MDD4386368.1 hypothetical protein [Clostridia bacterium]